MIDWWRIGEKINLNSKAEKKEKVKREKAPKDFKLIKAIRAEKDYKSNVIKRDRNVRKFIDENYNVEGKPSVMPGQLVMFNYFEPSTKEELEYYDAMPCTIFFGILTLLSWYK